MRNCNHDMKTELVTTQKELTRSDTSHDSAL